MQNVRTDLAIEMHEMLMEAADELSGVTVRQEQKDNVHISRISIESLAAQRKMGKPIGHYITVEFQGVNIAEGEDYEALCRVVAKELSGLLSLKEKSNVLVVGLGNQNITPDALGPQVVSKLMVTSTGRPVFSLTANKAALASYRSVMVSITAKSAPAASPALAIWAKRA